MKDPGNTSTSLAPRDGVLVLDDRSRQYCDACLPEYREAQINSFADTGRAKLKAVRAAGIDPSKSEAATEKRRASMQRRRQEEIAWDAAHAGTEIDETVFAREILPGLQIVSLTQMSVATGLSQQYCSLIRRGLKVPHSRHWETFRNLSSHDANYEC